MHLLVAFHSRIQCYFFLTNYHQISNFFERVARSMKGKKGGRIVLNWQMGWARKLDEKNMDFANSNPILFLGVAKLNGGELLILQNCSFNIF